MMTVCANWHVAFLIIGIILLLILMVMLMATPRRTRSDDFKDLNRINLYKKAVIFLRILLISMFLCFFQFIDSIDLTQVKIFTVISFLLIVVDILLNLIILFHRIKGLCRPGNRYPYARLNEDYIELQAGSRNLNEWLNSPNEKRMGRSSYRSNIVSEIHSIPGGPLSGPAFSNYENLDRSRRSKRS